MSFCFRPSQGGWGPPEPELPWGGWGVISFVSRKTSELTLLSGVLSTLAGC